MTPARVLGPDFHADPHPALRELREAGPVHRVQLPDGAERWLVTRYHDVRAALADPRLSSELDRGVATAAPNDVLVRVRSAEVFRTTMLNRDGAAHDRLRRLVVRAFSASRVDKLHHRLAEIAEELLDGVGDLTEPVDLIDRYAFPIPSILTCELLGVPLVDRPHFRGLIEDMLAKPAAGAMAAIQGLLDYIRGQLKTKRAEPGDDLLSDLIELHEAGDRLDDDELVAMGFTLLFGGVGSTVHLIGNALAELLTHPEQRAAALADPAGLEAVVDEVLRHEPPQAAGIVRYAIEDVPIGGVTIPAGSYVLVGLMSANRDPEVFDHPDVFDVTRADNPHLSFGLGHHYCIGARLARIEGVVAIGALLRRFPDAQPAAKLEWKPVIQRSLSALPVLLKPTGGGQ